ncbi:MAG: carboxypeptidase-like regulatory domain-containing protein [Thermoplasmatota archaeon]
MRAILLVLSLLLAGCSDPSSTSPVPAAPGPTTGSLSGIVVDPAIIPLEGVRLWLDGQDRNVTTDNLGTWRMDGLEPGSYFLFAARDGFQPIQTGASVTAGEVTEVALEMVPNMTAEPFSVPTQWRGFIDCSLRIGTGGASGSVGLNACNELGTQGLGQQDVERIHEFPEGAPDFFQTEVQWEKTQTGGNDLAIMVGPDTCADPKYRWTSGASPLWYAMDAFELNARQVGPDAPLCTRVFAATSGDLQYVAGFQFQQGFDAYSHAFYNFEPEDGWLFVMDGPPKA